MHTAWMSPSTSRAFGTRSRLDGLLTNAEADAVAGDLDSLHGDNLLSTSPGGAFAHFAASGATPPGATHHGPSGPPPPSAGRYGGYLSRLWDRRSGHAMDGLSPTYKPCRHGEAHSRMDRRLGAR